MTRHTAPIRRVTARITLEAEGERDESDPYRHKWSTTLRFGLLSASGPNLAAAREALEAELLALASSDAATTALSVERARLGQAREAELAATRPTPVLKYEVGATVEVRLAHTDVWSEAEYLSSLHGDAMHAVWSECFGSLECPDERVRPVNRAQVQAVE